MKRKPPKYKIGEVVVRYPSGEVGKVVTQAYFDNCWTYQIRLGCEWYYEPELITPEQFENRIKF